MRAFATVAVSTLSVAALVSALPGDPCAKIAGQKWVSPRDVRACYSSFPVDQKEKSNIIEVINKTLAFHASTNYQIKAPEPYTSNVHEDLLATLAKIGRQTQKNDYDLHIGLSRTLKRVNDGHCVWVNYCYDSAYVNYLPIPLVLLTDKRGSQHVTIAPAAFEVASAEFPDQIELWQNSLPPWLKGKLESLNGARVILINGLDPFVAVNANAAITGGYQAFGTRQNSFFSSYQLAATGWNYIMGNFAQQSLPLDDQVVLTIKREGVLLPETIILPYRSRFAGTAFTDSASYRQNNCKAKATSNGQDYYASSIESLGPTEELPIEKAEQQPKLNPEERKKFALNVLLDDIPVQNVVLPERLKPGLPSSDADYSVARYYLLEDGVTGVLALGSFSAPSYWDFQQSLLDGLQDLKAKGATRLLVDITNNGGGYVCVAVFLHRLLAGAKLNTVPQAGFDTTARAGPLAQEIVQSLIDKDLDPEQRTLYSPLNWRDENNDFFGPDRNWLQPTRNLTINGNKDYFSPRLGNECYPEGILDAPEEAVFDPKQVVIIGNGRCASSCSIFSIHMQKLQGARTVVVGGKKSTPQSYSGIVGGQSTNFATIDSEIKTAKLKTHGLAPPDLLVNGVQGITWRLGFGYDQRDEPEEWQARPANLNLALDATLANNPQAVWYEVVKQMF